MFIFHILWIINIANVENAEMYKDEQLMTPQLIWNFY
jgi:hypothetical protein